MGHDRCSVVNVSHSKMSCFNICRISGHFKRLEAVDAVVTTSCLPPAAALNCSICYAVHSQPPVVPSPNFAVTFQLLHCCSTSSSTLQPSCCYCCCCGHCLQKRRHARHTSRASSAPHAAVFRAALPLTCSSTPVNGGGPGALCSQSTRHTVVNRLLTRMLAGCTASCVCHA